MEMHTGWLLNNGPPYNKEAQKVSLVNSTTLFKGMIRKNIQNKTYFAHMNILYLHVAEKTTLVFKFHQKTLIL